MLRVPCCIAALPSQRAAAEPAAAAAAANGLAAAAREVPCVVGSVPTLVQRGAIPGPLQLEKIVRGLLRMRWWQHGLAAAAAAATAAHPQTNCCIAAAATTAAAAAAATATAAAAAAAQPQTTCCIAAASGRVGSVPWLVPRRPEPRPVPLAPLPRLHGLPEHHRRGRPQEGERCWGAPTHPRVRNSRAKKRPPLSVREE